jgi:hypothetical protein
LFDGFVDRLGCTGSKFLGMMRAPVEPYDDEERLKDSRYWRGEEGSPDAKELRAGDQSGYRDDGM